MTRKHDPSIIQKKPITKNLVKNDPFEKPGVQVLFLRTSVFVKHLTNRVFIRSQVPENKDIVTKI